MLLVGVADRSCSFSLKFFDTTVPLAKRFGELCDVLLERQHSVDPGQVQAGLGQFGDSVQPVKVCLGVPARPTGGSSRGYQPFPFIDPERLWMYAGEFGGDADDVDGLGVVLHVPSFLLEQMVSYVGIGQAGERLGLLVGEVGRYHDLDGDEQVAGCLLGGDAGSFDSECST